MNSSMLTGLIRSRQVKDYICQHFCEIPEALQHALQHSEEAGLKAIHVPDTVAKTLYILASSLLREKF